MKDERAILDLITDKVLAYGPSKKNASKEQRPPKKTKRKPVKRAKKLRP
jgi:hypothetical protein